LLASEREAFFDEEICEFANVTLSLNDLFNLLTSYKQLSKEKHDAVKNLYVKEPMTIFSTSWVCASSPQLAVFTAAELYDKLERNCRDYLVQTCFFDINTRNLNVPCQFKDYMKCFGESKNDVLMWIVRQLPNSHMKKEILHSVRASEARNSVNNNIEDTQHHRIKLSYSVFRYDFQPRFRD
jgi:hypothetical protein